MKNENQVNIILMLIENYIDHKRLMNKAFKTLTKAYTHHPLTEKDKGKNQNNKNVIKLWKNRHIFLYLKQLWLVLSFRCGPTITF